MIERIRKTSRGIVSWPQEERPRERLRGLDDEQFRVLYVNRRKALPDDALIVHKGPSNRSDRHCAALLRARCRSTRLESSRRIFHPVREDFRVTPPDTDEAPGRA